MKIYVSHSTNFDYETELYEPFRVNFSELDMFFPHEKDGKLLDTKQIIKESGLVLAEASYPSTGQGIELGWANTFDIPIVCIYRDGTKPSSALRIVSHNFINYSSADELVDKLRKVI